MSSCWRISCRCCSLRRLFCEGQVLLAAASGWSPPSRPQASLSHWTKWIWIGTKCKDIYHHPCNSYTSGICFALLQRAWCCSSGKVNWSCSPAFPACLRPGLWLWLEMQFFPVGMVSKCPITQESGVNSHSGEKKREEKKGRKSKITEKSTTSVIIQPCMGELDRRNFQSAQLLPWNARASL